MCKTAKHVKTQKKITISDFAKIVILSSIKYLCSVTFIGHACSFNWINTIDDLRTYTFGRDQKGLENKNYESFSYSNIYLLVYFQFAKSILLLATFPTIFEQPKKINQYKT